MCQHVFGHFGLYGWVFKHRLDDQITPRQRSVIRGGGDQIQRLGFLFFARLAAFDTLVHVVGGIGFALVGGLLLLVDQDHLHPGHGRYQRDAGPHHASAHHTNLFDLLVRHVGAVGPFFQCFLVDEQAADHRRGRGVHQYIGEPTRLDFQGRVKGHQRPLIDRRQQCLGRRKRALGLAVDHGRSANKVHETSGVIGGTAGQFIALFIPWFHNLRL